MGKWSLRLLIFRLKKLVARCRRFGGTYCLHIQNRKCRRYAPMNYLPRSPPDVRSQKAKISIVTITKNYNLL
jgi:hypothetical protein